MATERDNMVYRLSVFLADAYRGCINHAMKDEDGPGLRGATCLPEPDKFFITAWVNVDDNITMETQAISYLHAVFPKSLFAIEKCELFVKRSLFGDGTLGAIACMQVRLSDDYEESERVAGDLPEIQTSCCAV